MSFITQLRLLGLDPSGFDDLRRAFTLAQDETRELGLRHDHRLAPVLRDPVAQIRPGEHAPDVLRQLVNHPGRSASRGPYSLPKREVESGNARLRERYATRIRRHEP